MMNSITFENTVCGIFKNTPIGKNTPVDFFSLVKIILFFTCYKQLFQRDSKWSLFLAAILA